MLFPAYTVLRTRLTRTGEHLTYALSTSRVYCFLFSSMRGLV